MMEAEVTKGAQAKLLLLGRKLLPALGQVSKVESTGPADGLGVRDQGYPEIGMTLGSAFGLLGRRRCHS